MDALSRSHVCCKLATGASRFLPCRPQDPSACPFPLLVLRLSVCVCLLSSSVPGMLGVRDGRSTQQPIRSCPAPALQELLYPCCEAGGFFCLSCPAEGEKALLLSHNSAYNHMRRCAPNRPVPKGDFQSIFEWLHTEIAPRKFHDYSALLGARELHPAIPGRPVLRGWACDKCSHGFKEIGNAKRHSQGACSPAGTSAALIMELSERHFVAVSPLAC